MAHKHFSKRIIQFRYTFSNESSPQNNRSAKNPITNHRNSKKTYNPQNEKTIFPKRKRKVRSRKDQNESVQFPDTRTKIKQRLSALQMVFKRCFFL